PAEAARHLGARGIDPVCGMTPKPTTPHRTIHDGREVLFCSAGCLAKFTADPAKYRQGPPARAPSPRPPAPSPRPPAPGGAAPAHTCPMHPEVVQDGPGSCPICGMALEPMEVVADEGPDPEYVDMRRRLVVAAALTAPLLVLAMTDMIVPGAPIAAILPGRAQVLAQG